jgi:nucleotide-binding universal stress UspA family protein
MFKKILLPLDGSERAERALDPAFQLAEQFGGEVILLRVAVPEPVLASLPGLSSRPYGLYDAELRRDQEEAEAYLSALELQRRGAGVPIHTETISGAPAEMIATVAQEKAVDLIVMSTHGRSGVSRLLYGSVAEAVLRGARLPILLIPLDQ